MAVRKTAQAEIHPSFTCLQAGALWTLEKDGRFIDCTLHLDATGSVEAHIRRDAEICVITRFDDLAGALGHGHQLRSDLIATGGWQVYAAPR